MRQQVRTGQVQARPHDALRVAFEETRERTLLLLEGLDPALATRAAAPFLSPPVWDLGHIANFQDLWLLQRLEGRAERRVGDNDTYDALAHPRPERPMLPLMDLEHARRCMEQVQEEMLRLLPRVPLDAQEDRLVRDGFIHWMLVLHEHQHQETLLQSFAMHGDRYRPPQKRPPPDPHAPPQPGWCSVVAGPFAMGRDHGPGSYDNEAPRHTVDVSAFEIARYPVTNGEYLEFVEAGGYEASRWWSARGRRWCDEATHHAPLHWHHDGVWHRRTLRDGTRPVDDVADEILCHVTWFEAEAYARFRGARLPTEAEWEKACRHGVAPTADPAHANVDQLGWGPSRIGAYPDGAAPCGAQHMLGDVWEWCASGLDGYPGFEAFPYKEYSEVFFGGDYCVLRGGSWATRPSCATPTFRNWDHPYRNQLFAGVRLARDT